MAQVKFRHEGERVIMIGREPLTSENLTFEKYQALVAQYPELDEKFEVSDDASATKKREDNTNDE